MIWRALSLISDELRQYIQQTDAVTGSVDAPQYVIVDNIARAGTLDLTKAVRNRVVLSLVNIQEDITQRNPVPVGRNQPPGNAPAQLIAFMLCSADYESYETALTRVTQVVEFFHNKSFFTHTHQPPGNGPGTGQAVEEKYILELCALSLEEVSHLWDSLGREQVPFVFYKVRIVRSYVDRPLSGERLRHNLGR